MSSVTRFSGKQSRRLIDEAGKRYGRLEVLYRVNSDIIGAHWLCQCDCGNKTVVKGGNLRIGDIVSCGCWNSEVAARKAVARNTTHGYSKHETYGVIYNKLHGMKERCYNKNNSSYIYYGARGIHVCKEWMNDAGAFVDWALRSGWRPELSIDRINNDGPYSPENCRWATLEMQARNKTNTRMVEYNGEAIPLPVFVEDHTSCNYKTVLQRLHKGWNIERIAKTPPRRSTVPA